MYCPLAGNRRYYPISAEFGNEKMIQGTIAVFIFLPFPFVLREQYKQYEQRRMQALDM